MACKYLKQKLNGSLWCNKKNIAIKISNCIGCNDIEYKIAKSTMPKKPSNRLIEKQKKRFSIIYHNLSVCCNCGLKQSNFNVVDLNEVYEGSRRQASMANGFVIPLCRQCHSRYHIDRQFALKYKKMFQAEYEKTHTREEFLNLIHKSYL